MSESKTRLECSKHGVLARISNSLPLEERSRALDSHAKVHFHAYPDCAGKVTMRKDPDASTD